MKNTRLRHIDFLRGIAILLVLVKHARLFSFTTNMAWLGVDLFFVLSGFLVSGLLFKEFIKFGEVKPVLFLIRRGFKIYPVFWLALILFLIIKIYDGSPIIWFRFISEIIFLQNYVNGWGYALNGVSWSLAVEEHFYFGLALVFPFAIRKNWFGQINNFQSKKLEAIIFSILIFCLIMRIVSNYFFPYYQGRNWSMTHLRIDSLLAGVLVSYWYYFKKDLLNDQYQKYKRLIIPFSLLLLIFSPFIPPVNSFFVKTIGFTMAYVSFSLILIYFILNPDINSILNKYLGKRLINVVSKIGYYSYSIYLFHSFVNNFFDVYLMNPFLKFIIANMISIIAGMLISRYIEYYFLKLRDKWWPARR